MKPPANDNDTPSDQSAKTVCLDCGCEFQTAGSARDQNECPICSQAKGHVEEPNSLEWAQILRPKPTDPSDDPANGTPKAIEVEVTSSTGQGPRTTPPATTSHPASNVAPRPGNPTHASPPEAPPARTPESTNALYDDLREIGFQIDEEDAT